jgi:thioredoxin reductase (NADPH)
MFGGRYGLSVGLVDQMGAGGQILNAEKIENMPGFPQGVAGFDLGPMIQEQAEAVGAEFVFDTAEGIEVDGATRILRCAEEELHAKAIIIAAGSSLRNLGVPGEEKFMGRGVSHCASCDAGFFGGQAVAVIGGGDSAIDEAITLAEHDVGQITVYHRGPQLRTQNALIDAVRGHSNIEIVLNTQVEEILGDDMVSGVRLREAGGAVREQPLSGVFVFIGLDPNTAFLQGVVDLDPSGHIVTDIMMRTSVEGIFAAGDIRQHSVAQLASSAGDGCTAAIAAYRYINAQG